MQQADRGGRQFAADRVVVIRKRDRLPAEVGALGRVDGEQRLRCFKQRPGRATVTRARAGQTWSATVSAVAPPLISNAAAWRCRAVTAGCDSVPRSN